MTTTIFIKLLGTYCPSCGEESLYVIQPQNANIFLECRNEKCTRREAVMRVLRDREIGHIVLFSDVDAFSMQHPIRERIDSELLDCELMRYLSEHGAPSLLFGPGKYRAIPSAVRGGDTTKLGVHEVWDGWAWERLD